MFVAGGVSGFFLAQPSIDIYLHATYFVVGHFHMVMGVASLFGVFAGTYFWFPKMTGRMMSEPLGKLHFWITFIGTYCIFMPFHYLGLIGNVRRYQSFVDDFMAPYVGVHKFITICALITGGGAVHLPVQFDLQPLQRQTGPGKSVERHLAGMDDPFAAALEQFRRQAPGRVSRSLSVWGEGIEG